MPCGFLGKNPDTGRSKLKAPEVGTCSRAGGMVSSLVWLESSEQGSRVVGLERQEPDHVGPALQTTEKALDLTPNVLGSHGRALSRRVI